MSKTLKNKSLELALAAMKKTYGSNFLKLGSDLEQVSTFRTGHDDLDAVLVKDGFGVARGKVIELFGSEAAGKSSVALRVCGYAQKEGCIPFWIDLERSLVKGGIAEINGVDMDNFYMPDLAAVKDDKDDDDEKEQDTNPFNAGKVLDMMLDAIKTGAFNPVVLDSIAGLIPEREMNAESFNKEQMMEVARLMSRALKKINEFAGQNGICVIFINQERDKPVPGGPSTTTTPGGRALRFFASQRLRVSKVGGKEGEIKKFDEDGAEKMIGHWARVKIVKNRCAPPYNDPIEIPIYYEKHFPDDAERIYEAARILKVITVRSNVVTWKSGNDIVFKVEGVSTALHKIRTEGLSGKLAYECSVAQTGEKNTKNYKLPSTLQKMADEYQEELKNADKPV